MTTKTLLIQARDAMENPGTPLATYKAVIAALQSAIDAPEPAMPVSWELLYKSLHEQYNTLKRVAYRYNVQVSLLNQKLSSLGEDDACRDIEKQAIENCQGSSAAEPQEVEGVAGSIPTSDTHLAPIKPLTDERETFEQWIAKSGGDLGKFGIEPNIHYSNSAVSNAWTGWKARATEAAIDTPASKTKRMEFAEFLQWAGVMGYDTAHTCNSDTGEWICLNPMTKDAWGAWRAAVSRRAAAKAPIEVSTQALAPSHTPKG